MGWQVIAFGGVLALLLGPVVGANIHPSTPARSPLLAFSVFALVAFWRALHTGRRLLGVGIDAVIHGVGIGCFFLPLVTINLSGLAPSQIAAATGLQNFMRNLGSSFGTAIMTALWGHKGIEHHARLVEHVTAYNPLATQYLDQLQAVGLTAQQAWDNSTVL